MDIFCEFLVEKKSTSDKLKKLSITALCVLLCYASLYLCFFVFLGFLWLVPILWGIFIYATVFLRRMFSIEYEYAFTNGVLDIDAVYGRARRKNLASIVCRNIERMAPLHKGFSTDRKIISAIYDESRGNKYYVNFSQGGIAYTLTFQPPEKILSNMKKYNPRNIEL